MERILDVAGYIIREYKAITGESVDEMKLHKLLYFAQRESFAVTGEPLFTGELQGWKFGPVSPEIRMNFFDGDLTVSTGEISLDAAYIAKNIILEYGAIASWKLSEMTHRETSWLNARKGLAPGENGNQPLSLDDLRADAEKVRPYDHVWDMYYDEFEDLPEGGLHT